MTRTPCWSRRKTTRVRLRRLDAVGREAEIAVAEVVERREERDVARGVERGQLDARSPRQVRVVEPGQLPVEQRAAAGREARAHEIRLERTICFSSATGCAGTAAAVGAGTGGAPSAMADGAVGGRSRRLSRDRRRLDPPAWSWARCRASTGSARGRRERGRAGSYGPRGCLRGHRVVAAGPERMAARHASQREPAPAPGTVPRDRLAGVGGAGRLEAAARARGAARGRVGRRGSWRVSSPARNAPLIGSARARKSRDELRATSPPPRAAAPLARDHDEIGPARERDAARGGTTRGSPRFTRFRVTDPPTLRLTVTPRRGRSPASSRPRRGRATPAAREWRDARRSPSRDDALRSPAVLAAVRAARTALAGRPPRPTWRRS